MLTSFYIHSMFANGGVQSLLIPVFAPKTKKKSDLIEKTLTHRVLMICSELKMKLKKITEIFRFNGYSESVILNYIKFKIAKSNCNKTFGLFKCLVYITIP